MDLNNFSQREPCGCQQLDVPSKLGFMMKTILTHNNELFMETFCIENCDNFKNVLGYPKEKMCPPWWIMAREEMGPKRWVGLEKRCSLRRRCVSGMDSGQGENGGKNVLWGEGGLDEMMGLGEKTFLIKKCVPKNGYWPKRWGQGEDVA